MLRVLACRPTLGAVLLCGLWILARAHAQGPAAPAAGASATEDASAPRGEASDIPPTASRSSEDAAAQAPTDPAAAEAAPGTVHVVVFTADNQPAVGAILRLPDGTEVTTDDSGAAELPLAAGNHRIELRWPPGAPAKGIDGVTVTSGLTTELIVTVAADGTLALDLMPPEVEVAEAANQAKIAQNLPTGTVAGVVTGEDEGEPVVGAGVFVAGQQAEASTDAEGHFKLELPIGTHTLSIIHGKYSTQTLPNVKVEEGKATKLQVSLTPAAIELQEFVVTAPHISGGVASVLDSRRKSAAVSDAIGAADIARMPASNAAQAAQRVVGATIVGGRFVYVRGLGERYTNALLNGAPLPSPEPDRATVPLDMFPSQILESIDISKTFTPDVPGDFAGGSVRIVTKGVPDGLLFGTSLSLGYNTESTFRQYFGQSHRGSLDVLGFDDGGRALSSAVPTDYPLKLSAKKPDGSRVSRDELNHLTSALNSPMALKRRTLWPNFNGNVAVGNGWKLSADKRVGFLASLIYRRNYRLRREEMRDFEAYRPGDGDAESTLDPRIDYPSHKAADEVRWGAFTSGALQWTKAHKLSLVGMHSQLADTNTNLYEGYNHTLDRAIAIARQEYISRGLTNGQLQGKHQFTVLNNAQLDWLASLAYAVRNEDDTRDFVFLQRNPDEEWSYYDGVESGRHFFSEQYEVARTGGLDWSQPLLKTKTLELKAKAGGLFTLKDREFGSRTFTLRPARGAADDFSRCGFTFDPIACPNVVYADENLGTNLTVGEATGANDAYHAALNVYAGYLMAELALGDVRVIGGARAEHTYQKVQSYDQFGDEVRDDDGALLEQTDLLPAASIVYSPFESAALRVAVSQTLARPQLRELAPFPYVSVFGGYVETGNPDLKLTRILNGDLRFEFFPSPQEVAAISLFAKDFTRPIEPILRPTADGASIGYRNSKGAILYGVEFELRKNLGFLNEALSDFGLIASLMLADSEIEVEQTGNMFITSEKRAMVQAAPYVVNVALDYENDVGTQIRLLYNLTGSKLIGVGVDGLEDKYALPQHMLDLTASQALGERWKLRLNLQNILNARYVESYGGRDEPALYLTSYREGVTGSLSLAYNH